MALLLPSRIRIFAWFAALFPVAAFAQTIELQFISHGVQTGASTGSGTGYTFEAHLYSGGADVSTWAPKLIRPGQSSPDSGASGATNTGTLNFSRTPNDGSNYSYQYQSGDPNALATFYPLGTYGIKFTGPGAPTSSTVTEGLTDNSRNIPTDFGSITGVDHGAYWNGSGLTVSTTGTTDLSLKAFSQYSSSTYGAVMDVALYDPSGNKIADQQVVNVNGFANQAAFTAYALNDSLLTPGQTYSLSVQYELLDGTPAATVLNGTSFEDYAFDATNLTVSITAAAVPEPSTTGILAGLAALGVAGLARSRFSARQRA